VRFARRERISDKALTEAVARAERGLVDVDLGGGLLKQRVARKGQGRSGGFRTLIAYRQGARSVFMYGFAKNEKDNIDPDEVDALRTLAERLLGAADAGFEAMIVDQRLTEVGHDEDETQQKDPGGDRRNGGGFACRRSYAGCRGA
jgi:hypothetical protein